MLRFIIDGEDQGFDFEPQKLLLAGYTGRNQEAVRKHIEELKEQGIPAPNSVPALYPVISDRLTTAAEIDTLDNNTSGEVEFVLLVKGNEVFVGVGSDHTDRKLEEHSIVHSKQMCAKPVSELVWRLSELLDHWDSLELRSWVEEDGKRVLYQSGKVDAILPPQAILDLAREHIEGGLDGAAIYSGTLATVSGRLISSLMFSCELHDPVRQRSLHCHYKVKPLSWLK